MVHGNDARKPMTRRDFFRTSARGAVALGLAGGTARNASAAGGPGADGFGPLQAADSNGLKLPVGFTSRVVAVSDTTVTGTSHTWQRDPDGGATFATGDGGWIYACNSERGSGNGGVDAIRFASDGTITDAYSILTGTSRNCAGGATPWQTWLSCEETGSGRVWECDPFTPGSEGGVRPALGTFQHEAVAVDPVTGTLILTEDRTDSLLYRFTPTFYPDLASGTLEALEILDPLGQGAISPGQVRPIAWHDVPDPTASVTETRDQVPAATTFNGGEGCDYEDGSVYFSTKGDNRVWKLDMQNDTIGILYDKATSGTPILSGVDNVMTSGCGDVYVAEDGGDLEIVALTPSGGVVPIVQLVGVSGTEITGPALSPDGTRLYFNSQRNPGTTYEVSGPFAPLQSVPSLTPVAGLWLGLALGVGGAFALRWRSREAD